MTVLFTRYISIVSFSEASQSHLGLNPLFLKLVKFHHKIS